MVSLSTAGLRPPPAGEDKVLVDRRLALPPFLLSSTFPSSPACRRKEREESLEGVAGRPPKRPEIPFSLRQGFAWAGEGRERKTFGEG